MILKRFIMQFIFKRIFHINIRQMSNYEKAIEALNNLQSNADYIRNRSYNNTSSANILEATTVQDKKYLERSGVTWDQLDKLSVIHVTGTKGKGSTCAYTESILRHHGFRTGFYSSPHLIEVRERIRINGTPISKELFAQYFWDLYNTLQQKKTNEHDMPLYFRFLTIMAFKVFIEENVDVAVIEVGIGGEYDCTNILRNVPVVGITSLGLDHVNLLGNTIESIAWNKAGIMKEGSKVFTVPQTEAAMKVLQERSIEKKSELHVVPCDLNNNFLNCFQNIPESVVKTNVNLAIALSKAWLSVCGNNINKLSPETVKKAIITCSWLGRYQIINSETINFYVDGAHTVESIEICAKWYIQQTKNSSNLKALIFNTTGGRNYTHLLLELYKCNFNIVIFVPNVARKVTSQTDNKNVVENDEFQLKRCKQHADEWKRIQENNLVNRNTDKIEVFSSILEAVNFLNQQSKCDVLITGSLHLVGAALSVIQEESQLLTHAI